MNDFNFDFDVKEISTTADSPDAQLLYDAIQEASISELGMRLKPIATAGKNSAGDVGIILLNGWKLDSKIIPALIGGSVYN